jgi:hypothetical protein
VSYLSVNIILRHVYDSAIKHVPYGEVDLKELVFFEGLADAEICLGTASKARFGFHFSYCRKVLMKATLPHSQADDFKSDKCSTRYDLGAP